MSTRITLLVEPDEPALRAQLEEVAELPPVERDEIYARLMIWEGERRLLHVGEARGRDQAFDHNRRPRHAGQAAR